MRGRPGCVLVVALTTTQPCNAGRAQFNAISHDAWAGLCAVRDEGTPALSVDMRRPRELFRKALDPKVAQFHRAEAGNESGGR
jgi:hypothetical protein